MVDAFSKVIEIQYKVNTSNDDFKESELLNLVSDKSKQKLNWRPVWDFEKTIYRTASWYNKILKNDSIAYDLCMEDISEFMKDQNI